MTAKPADVKQPTNEVAAGLPNDPGGPPAQSIPLVARAAQLAEVVQ